jgi:hypothetical protein
MSQEQTGNGGATSRVKEEFAALPLDSKFAALFEMEVAAISEGISYVVNSPMDVVNKVGDVITEFGAKVEQEFKKATSNTAGAAPAAGPENASTDEPKTKGKGTKKPEGGTADQA